MSLCEVAQQAMDWRDMIASALISRSDLDSGGADKGRFLRPLGRILRQARIVIWDREIYMLAQRGFDKFVGLSSLPSAIPMDSEFWFFNNFHIPCLQEEMPKWQLPQNSQVEAMAITVHPEAGPTASFFFNRPDKPVTRSRLIRFPLDKTTAPFAALASFLQEEIVGAETISLPRPMRRRMARANVAPPDIRIVQLRRSMNEAGSSRESDIEWRHKWIVSGHWRRLSQPRRSDGALLTFVRAYVKGPDHLPLLQPRETVFAATR